MSIKLRLTTIAAGMLAANMAMAESNFVSIGTGGVTGVYYPAGGAICRLMNKTKSDHGFRCSAESTGGSIYNINNVRAGELEFGVAQSDWQYHAYHGTSSFEDQGEFKDLRAVFSLHAEPVTVMARKDSGIAGIEDVKGKRLNIGNPGSGTRGTWDVLAETLSISEGDLKLAAEMKSAEVSQALCDNKIDSYFWLIGHPAALMQETVATCDAQFVPVEGDKIDELVGSTPYYRKAVIPAGMYNNEADVPTFGVGATVITSASVSEDAVYTLVKSVFDNFEDFKKLHPAFANLKPEEMISDALSAPLHPGAEKYYREQGWM
jgi:uncharacterized protein